MPSSPLSRALASLAKKTNPVLIEKQDPLWAWPFLDFLPEGCCQPTLSAKSLMSSEATDLGELVRPHYSVLTWSTRGVEMESHRPISQWHPTVSFPAFCPGEPQSTSPPGVQSPSYWKEEEKEETRKLWWKKNIVEKAKMSCIFPCLQRPI